MEKKVTDSSEYVCVCKSQFRSVCQGWLLREVGRDLCPDFGVVLHQLDVRVEGLALGELLDALENERRDLVPCAKNAATEKPTFVSAILSLSLSLSLCCRGYVKRGLPVTFSLLALAKQVAMAFSTKKFQKQQARQQKEKEGKKVHRF